MSIKISTVLILVGLLIAGIGLSVKYDFDVTPYVDQIRSIWATGAGGVTNLDELQFDSVPGSTGTIRGSAYCRIQNSTSTCSVRNTTGNDVYAFVTLVMATSSTAGTNDSWVRASSTMLHEVATSSTAFPGGYGEYTNLTGNIIDNWRVATNTRGQISSYNAATSTNNPYAPVLWRNGDWIFAQILSDSNTCSGNDGAAGSVAGNGRSCEAASSTNRGYNLEVWVDYLRR